MLNQGLASLKDRYPDLIDEVRGSGLMLGIKCVKSNVDLVMAMRNGIFCWRVRRGVTMWWRLTFRR